MGAINWIAMQLMHGCCSTIDLVSFKNYAHLGGERRRSLLCLALLFMIMSYSGISHNRVSLHGKDDLKLIVSGFEVTMSSPGHFLVGDYAFVRLFVSLCWNAK